MSTKSLIAIENTDGTVTSIYCHWDGYLKGCGKTLLKHYNNRDTIEQLTALGNISALGKRIEPMGQHSFKSPEDGVTIAYHRDRGDAWDAVKSKCFESLDAFLSSDFGGQDAAYFYIFTKDDIWTVYSNRDGMSIQKMQIWADMCPISCWIFDRQPVFQQNRTESVLSPFWSIANYVTNPPNNRTVSDSVRNFANVSTLQQFFFTRIESHNRYSISRQPFLITCIKITLLNSNNTRKKKQINNNQITTKFSKQKLASFINKL
jgi:hypothetical protein